MQQSPPSCPIIAVLHKEVDSNVNSKLIYLIQEKIEDTLLVAFMQKSLMPRLSNWYSVDTTTVLIELHASVFFLLRIWGRDDSTFGDKDAV